MTVAVKALPVLPQEKYAKLPLPNAGKVVRVSGIVCGTFEAELAAGAILQSCINAEKWIAVQVESALSESLSLYTDRQRYRPALENGIDLLEKANLIGRVKFNGEDYVVPLPEFSRITRRADCLHYIYILAVRSDKRNKSRLSAIRSLFAKFGPH